MEETQAIDFDDLPTEDEEPVQIDFHQVLPGLCSLCKGAALCLPQSLFDCSIVSQVVGELQTISEPTDRLPLYLGELRFVTAYCLRQQQFRYSIPLDRHVD